MRRVLIVLAVLALAGTAFFGYHANHQHEAIGFYIGLADGERAKLEAASSDTSLTPEERHLRVEERSSRVEDMLDSARRRKDLRNQYLAFGAGPLALAVIFVVLARRKRKPSAVAA